MRFPILLISAAFVLSPATVGASQSSQIKTLFGHDPGEKAAFACFSRHYAKAHLASHPDQNVTDMRVFVSKAEGDTNEGYTVGMQVDFREQKQPLVLTNYCEPGEGKQAITCPFDCEGGRIDMRVKNQSSILVEIPIGARVYDPPVEDGVPVRGKFGEDDKLFRLDRAALTDCLPAIKDDALRAKIAKGAVTE